VSIRHVLSAVAAGCVLWGALDVPIAARPAEAVTPIASAADLRDNINKYCVTCHNSRLKTAGLELDTKDAAHVGVDAATWEKVARKLRSGAMPPANARRPDSATADAMVRWLETSLDAAAAAAPNPGRPVAHRMNRAEYANAVRDLLAIEIDPATLLPPDDSAQGFDNIADALAFSPSLVQGYLTAAGRISALAVGNPSIGPSSWTFHVRGDASQAEHVEGLGLGTRGGLLAEPMLPLDGDYVIKVKLLQTNLGSVRGLQSEDQLEITLDGERVHLASIGGMADYTAAPDNATDVANAIDARLQVRVSAKAGPRQIGAAFLQKASSEGGNRLQSFLRTTLIATDHLGLPHVESVTITGPFDARGPGDTPSRRRIFTCVPERASDELRCARTIITTLAHRGFRRQPTTAEVDRLVDFYRRGRQGQSFDHGIEMAIRGILASPKFLVRVEQEPLGSAQGGPLTAGSVYRISDIELASRLSFFLWSSIPDDELLKAAEAGKLSDRATLHAQVRRMLADRRADALVSNFAGQWLYLRNVRTAEPDKNAFPDFDDNLRQSFQRETELFVNSIMREDHDVLDLLTADYTFVNERLARHYRIPGVYGSQFRRVSIADDARRGLLGQGSILMVTSHADRTSPVVRGKWILDNLLGAPPPPPLPNAGQLKDTPDDGQPHSLRARMEEHRANPICASCHKVMDPIGFSLENFDAVGAWRSREGDLPIDASGQLADGTPVDGVVTLRNAILRRPEIFVSTMTEKMLTYALGRGLMYYDLPAVRDIVRQSARADYRFSSLVLGIVDSLPFQMRMKG
jgi:mono/diheme cytochrome c family protein